MTKISFERTGGFANLRLSLNLDLENLPAEEAAGLQKLVDNANLTVWDPKEAKTGFMDGFQYNLTVEMSEGQSCSLEVSDGSLTEEIKPLLDELSIMARSRRRHGRDDQ